MLKKTSNKSYTITDSHAVLLFMVLNFMRWYWSWICFFFLIILKAILALDGLQEHCSENFPKNTTKISGMESISGKFT